MLAEVLQSVERIACFDTYAGRGVKRVENNHCGYYTIKTVSPEPRQHPIGVHDELW